MWLFGLSLLVVVCTARCTEADVSVEAAFQGEWHEHGFFASSICLKMFMIAVQNSRETPFPLDEGHNGGNAFKMSHSVSVRGGRGLVWDEKGFICNGFGWTS